jgi:hypothetical protein
MMKTRRASLYTALFLTVILLAGCQNPFADKLTVKNPGNGLLLLSMSDGNAAQRTLIPSDTSFSRYELRFTGEGKEPVAISSTSSAVDIELESGTWELTVKGYVMFQGKERLAAEGGKTITIAAGSVLHESIALTAGNTGEEGLFSYDIRLSLDTGSLSRALFVFESLDGNDQDNKEINLKEEGAETGTFKVKPGFYLIKVRLENGYQAAGKTEVVHIYTNMETTMTHSFGPDDLTRTIPLEGTAWAPAGKDKVELFIYSDENCEDLIISAEVDLSDGTWKTAIPSGIYAKVYFRLFVKDGTGFSLKSAGSDDVPELGKTGMRIIPVPEISSFSISAGETGLDAGIVGVIDAENGRILLATQKWLEHIDNLKATFDSTGVVTVSGVSQKSGITAQNFRNAIIYKVTTEDNATKEYTVVLESPQLTGLPVMKIDTQGREITSTDVWFKKLNGDVVPSYTIYKANGEKAQEAASMDIKGRGNSTWGMPKKPYSLKLDSGASLLDMPAHKRWNLLANYSDKTLLRTETAFKIGEILEDGLGWTPRSRHIQLFLNNAYQGVYQLAEAIKIDENRVDIKEITKKKNPQGGYILEIDVRGGEDFNFTTTRGIVFNCSDPDEDLDEEINGDTKTLFEKIKEDVQHAEDVLYSEGFADPDEGYRKYLDVDSFVDWYLVNELTKNNDAVFFTSVYMYYDQEKERYCMGPVWDFDISLGNIDYNDNDNPEGFWIKGSSWISRLFEDPEFVSSVKDRWNEKQNEFNDLPQYIDGRAAYLQDAQAQNFKLWDILGVYVWPNAVVAGSYQGETGYLKSWLAARLAWFDTAINQL